MSDELEGLTLVVETPVTPPVAEPVVPPVVEPPVDEPPAAAIPPVVESPVPTTPPEVVLPNAMDLLSDPTTAPVTPPVELSEDIKAQLALAEEYKQFLIQAETNPIYKAIKMGIDPEGLKKVVAEIAPENYNNYSYEQLLAIEIKGDLGLEGDALKEAMDEHLEAHKAKTKIEQAREEKALKAKFTTGIKESTFLSEYEKTWKEAQANQPKPPTAQDLKLIADGDLALIDQVITPAKGAELFGVIITDEVIKQVKDSYNSNEILPYVKKDNTIDAKQFILDKVFLMNKENIIKAAEERGRKAAMKESTYISPPAGGQPPAGLGVPKTNADMVKDGMSEGVWI